jgi:hypothetical protein
MASRLLLAGLLKYSPELYDQIEQYMLKIYAAVFVPALKETADDAEKHLEGVKKRVARVRQLAKKLKHQPTHKAVQELISLLLPLALNGALRVDLKRLASSLGKGGGKKGLALLEKDMKTLEQAAQEKLGDQAEGMRKDLVRWQEHYDEDVAQQIRKGTKIKPLTIQLSPDQFPFLQGKFEDNVKKVRGEDAGLFDDMTQIQVTLASLGPGYGGFWNGEKGELVVGFPDLAPIDVVLPQLRQTLRHELAHVTQTVMARALGVRHLRTDKNGEVMPAYRPGPGMGPKDVLDPDIHQAFRDVDGLKKRVKQLSKYEAAGTLKPKQKKELAHLRRTLEMRKQVLSSRGLKSPSSTYSLDDLEFYTHLADRITEFEEKLEKLDLTPEQKTLARDLWTGRKWVPQKSKKQTLKWISENDPTHAVWPHFSQGSPFFRHLKKYQSKKYQKAVKEFVKATAHQFEKTPEKGSIKNLWEEFLAEVYEGGRKKVPNPNSKTRESHPEITLNYLMKQTDPAYSAARSAVRRRFARWRSARK